MGQDYKKGRRWLHQGSCKLVICHSSCSRTSGCGPTLPISSSAIGLNPHPVAAAHHLLQVNKIREVPQHPEVIVTHTDAPELYVWNTQTQPNAHRDKVRSGT